MFRAGDMASPAPSLDHGAIGNGRVLALVAPSTRIEWLCLPRFDSPSIFGALLDPERAGAFGFEPAGDTFDARLEYVANTNVLRTRLRTAEGVVDVFDFAPRIPAGLSVEAPLEIQRLLVPVEGEPRLRVRFDPRPDYGRKPAEIVPGPHGLEVLGGEARFHLRSNVPATFIQSGAVLHIDGPKYFAFCYGRPSETDSVAAAQRALDLTIAGWRAWAKSCALPSIAPASVLRSALCLKLHQSIDTGAIIAAATTSIPEALGTQRTWDYRYCWLRDAAFVVEALRRLSHLAEGEAFGRFLSQVAEQGPLQPVYGIGGERELVEEHLDHLAGFGGAQPVRIGNAAYQQKQNDLMGEMVLCLETLMTDMRLVQDNPEVLFRLVERLVEEAITVAPSTDTGLWEYRTMLRHYTFSQVMCWVAASRGARLARALGRQALAERWQGWADQQAGVVLARGYNAELGFFTQALDGKHPDASNLLLPTLGLIDARDPRFVSTVAAYERRLVDNGWMLRYRHPDDFGETTTAFTICSFWWAEALAMTGELDRAIQVFERLAARANPVGLFSEDVDPRTGKLLGNFPQAYTHVGLIHAAITIGELSEAKSACFRAWI